MVILAYTHGVLKECVSCLSAFIAQFHKILVLTLSCKAPPAMNEFINKRSRLYIEQWYSVLIVDILP